MKEGVRMKLNELLKVCRFSAKKVSLIELVDDDREYKETQIIDELIPNYYDYKVFDIFAEIKSVGKTMVSCHIKILIVKGD